MWCFSTLVAAGVLAHHAVAQAVSPPTDLISNMGHANVTVRYKQVPPGICELDAHVKSFSGYADVGKDQHIFWWFFETRNGDPTTAPLTVWINGGPGSSSMIGLFQELGPCGVDYFGKPYNNPFSWSNVSNMLFIDQPTETGFSYTKPEYGFLYKPDEFTMAIMGLPEGTPCPDYAEGKCGTWSRPDANLTPNSTAGAAPDFWKTLQGFMGAFPQYSGGGFHLTGESFAGHYIPYYAAYIMEQNAKKIPGAVPIRLESVAIGNGWIEPEIVYPSYYNFTVSPGNTYDLYPYSETQGAMLHNSLFGPGNCLDQVRQCRETGSNSVCFNALEFCVVFVEDLIINAGRDVYDIRELDPSPFPYEFYQAYLNQPEVQKAIGAYVNYSEANSVTNFNFEMTGEDARGIGGVEHLRSLLAAGVTVNLYAGDADFICNWMGVEATANAVGAPGWAEAGYTDLLVTPPNGDISRTVRGHTRQAGNFSFTRIWQAGHEVPFYQPAAALALFERTIRGLDVATGKQKVGPGYHTVGQPTSIYREGNATVQFAVVPQNITYDTNTDRPGKPWTQGGHAQGGGGGGAGQRKTRRRAVGPHRLGSLSLSRGRRASPEPEY